MVLVMFMGQSNMAGRGEAESAVVCSESAGYEFRAVTSPDTLYRISEPFGRDENRAGGIDDGSKKSGGMVTAFADEYHRLTDRSIIAVSASEGGTSLAQWRERLLSDAVDRLEAAKAYTSEHNIPIEHIYMLWCQGETDGDLHTQKEQYKSGFRDIYGTMKKHGVEKCFLVQIGHYNYIKHPEARKRIDGVVPSGQDEDYELIRMAQLELCGENEDIIFAGTFEDCIDDMKDTFHYHQRAYTKVGRQAADVMARYD